MSVFRKLSCCARRSGREGECVWATNASLGIACGVQKDEEGGFCSTRHTVRRGLRVFNAIVSSSSDRSSDKHILAFVIRESLLWN
jgi:hypothetical protein